MNMKRMHVIAVALFIIPIVFFGLWSFVAPDPTVSRLENRTLKARPAFSLQNLFDGSLLRDYEEYYSDTFPLRDMFLGSNQGILTLMRVTGEDDVTLVDAPTGDLGVGEHIDAGDAPSSSAPSSSTSSSASSTPSSSSSVSSEALPNVQIPDDTEVKENGGVIVAGDRAMELFSVNKSKLITYAQSVNRIKQLLPNVKVYNMVAPTSVEFYAPSKYHNLSQSQQEAIDIVAQNLQGVTMVNPYNDIAKHADEYLYFRTDHHWTARGAYYAYTSFARTAGFAPVAINDVQSGRIDDFVGSLYKTTQAQSLKNNPDYVEYFLPNVEVEGRYFSAQTLENGLPIHAVATSVKADNKYLAFIGGDTLVTRFQTDVKNDRKIMVIKESFANAMVPWLLNHYEEVYVCDPRQGDLTISSFVKEHDIDEVLILNYAFAANGNFYKYIDAWAK